MQHKILLTVVLSLSCISNVWSQEWTKRLPQKPDGEMTFRDVQQAFRNYYGADTLRFMQESIRPAASFTDAAGESKKQIEEYKLYKRWEWLVEPRTYGQDRLSMRRVQELKSAVPSEDRNLILKSSAIILPLAIWSPMGPSDAVGGTNLGRVNCITFDPGNTNTIYIGAPDGGVWKTTDAGATWATKFDSQPTLSVADIAIDPTNPKIVYAATSDGFGYGVPFWGGTYSVGVLKSMDGGASWAATGLSMVVGDQRTIRRLVIHPTNGKILMAATSNGLFRTADGGATWSSIWSTSTYDVEFQQNNGSIVYATTNQVSKSLNAGVSFTPLTASCAGSRYNIEIAKSNPNVLYTLCTTGAVQKSTNAGTTWSTVAASGVTLYGYYDNVLAVSPMSDKIVFVAGFNMKKSTDGGASWVPVPTAGHVDNHCVKFLPGSSTTIFCGNDGGLFKTINSGTSWSSLNKGLAITQFYRLGISRTNSNIMICGAQDNGNMKYNAGVFTNITNADGMEGFIDWSNANVIYAGIQNGGFYRSLDGGLTFTGISTPSGGAWVSPWCQHPTVARTIYAGTNKVYRSLNQGTTWTAMSPFLGGVGLFTVLKVAQSNPKVVYAGSGSKLYITKDDGVTWTDITAGLPVGSNYLTHVAINDNDPKTAYVTFSGYNAAQKVYKTINSGASWTNISGSLPNMPVNCIAYENNIKNALYVGTDAGVYYRNDGLIDWVPYKSGLPNVIVDELEIHYGVKKIRAATYGRGMWQAALKTP